MNRAAWGDYCERRYSGANSHFQRGLSDEGRNRRKNRRVLLRRFVHNCPQRRLLREFFRWPKVGGGKTEDGAHLWSQFSRMPRGTGKNRRHPGDMHGFLQLCLMVLAEAGTSKKSGWSWSGPTEISKNTCICQSEKPCCNWQIWRTNWEGESL